MSANQNKVKMFKKWVDLKEVAIFEEIGGDYHMVLKSGKEMPIHSSVDIELILEKWLNI